MVDTQEHARLHAIVQGRVQGVGFRYFVRQSVQGQPITGWVRNRYNGDVEVLAEGLRPVLEQLLRALQRGSASSNVTKVVTNWSAPSGEFKSFKIRMTV